MGGSRSFSLGHCMWSALAALAIATSSHAAVFIPLGDLPGGGFDSRATAISGDGRVVVGTGTGAAGSEAFRWEDGVMTGLGFAVANDVNLDGAVVVGNDGSQLPVRWVGGVATALPAPLVDALGVSDDGSVVVGYGTRSAPQCLPPVAPGDAAVTWYESSGLSYASSWMGRFNAYGAGSRGFGECLDPFMGTSYEEAIIINGFPVRLPGNGWDTGGACQTEYQPCGSEALDAAFGGEFPVAVGQSEWGGLTKWVGGTAFTYGYLSGAGNAVTEKGRTMVGTTRAGDPQFGWAFIHTHYKGVRNLETVLEQEHGLDLGSWTLNSATDISDDGRRIVGMGKNPSGDWEAWLVDFDPPEVPGLALWSLAALPLSLGGSGRALIQRNG